MFFLRQKTRLVGPFYDVLLHRKEEIRKAGAEIDGVQVTESTLVYQYEYVLSVLVTTLRFSTDYQLPSQRNGHLRLAPIKYTLISALFGWWCIPWGPIFTVKAFAANFFGTRRRTVGSLLTLLEWGYDAPPGASSEGLRRQVVTLAPSALAEINRLVEAHQYPREIAVRISPTKWADAECDVEFDYPISDGRDWIDTCDGLTVLVDRRDAELIDGKRLEFSDGNFTLD